MQLSEWGKILEQFYYKYMYIISLPLTEGHRKE